jgi:MATE family multidrug resistance protein
MLQEAAALAKLALPLAVEGISNVSLPLVTLAFVGRIHASAGPGGARGGGSPETTSETTPDSSALALSSAVMANSIFTVTGYSVVCGLASALETLAGAAFGAGEAPLLGVLWMRALLITLSACALPALVWVSGAVGPLLVAAGQPPLVAAGCARYLRLLAPAVFFSTVAETTQNYLLAQSVALPGMAITLVTLALSVVYNRALVVGFGGGGGGAAAGFFGGLGLDGAALAQVASFATLAALLTAYRMWRDGGGVARRRRRRRQEQHQAPLLREGADAANNANPSTRPEQEDVDDANIPCTWPERGWRTTVGGGVFAGWPVFFRVAYGAVGLVILEWACWELLVFLAGLLPASIDDPEIAVGVAGLAVQMSLPAYMISYAAGTAVSTRVAQGLGAGNALAAARSARTALVAILLVNASLALAMLSARDALPLMFTSDARVASMAARVVPAIAATMLFDGQVAALTGVLRGTGRQGLGAAAGLVAYYVVGLPLAWLFGFRARMGVLGLWLAPACGTALQAVFLHCYVWGGGLDWPKEVRRARRRLQRSGGGG